MRFDSRIGAPLQRLPSRGEWIALAGLILAPQLIIWNMGAVIAAAYESVSPGARALRRLQPLAEALARSQEAFLAESSAAATGEDGWARFQLAARGICGMVEAERPTLERARHASRSRAAEARRAEDSLSRACELAGTAPSLNRMTERRELFGAFHALAGQALAELDRAGVPFGSDDFGSSGYRRAVLNAIAGVITGLLCIALLRTRAMRSASATAALEPLRAAQPEVLPLDASERFFFFEVFDRGPAPQILFDGEGRILRMNRAAEALTGHTTASVSRRRYWEALLDHADAEQASARFPQPDLVTPVEETWLLRDGRRSRILLSRSFCHDDAGHLRYVIVAATPAESRDDELSRVVLDRHFQDELSLIGARAELLLERMPAGDANRANLVEILRASQRAVHAVRSLPQAQDLVRR